MDLSAPAQPAPGWGAQHLPKARTMVRRSRQTLSLEMNRARLQGRWLWVRLRLRREGMLGSLLAPRFPFLSLLV